MSIKEFSHKHSLIFFWSTIVLVIILIIITICSERGYGPRGMMKGGYYNDHNRYEKGQMMRGGYQRNIDNNSYGVEDVNTTNPAPVDNTVNQ